MDVYFRELQENNIENAYNIIEEQYQNLKNKGIKQYPFPFPTKENFIILQKENLNYGLFQDKVLLGIVSLTKNKKNTGWNINDTNYIWISSLYVNPKYRNNKIGFVIIDHVIKMMSALNINRFYLDCNKDSNFLEKYYGNYGFKNIDEKFFDFPKIKFNACLMFLDIENKEQNKHITKS